ncbi:CocE/NonD family hydrolase [Rhodococcus sp. MEB064]|uniref:CocE/NonD family hydrolase n=1 Tax=Rhodococcus sp. MEB064 TaxID=1587522 RepID=UPI0005B6DCE7|nr:CocE/NonD family hydrolase [Rhodococcus sp. MEB064]KIQ18343.1 X-Pro dipeptidyl-peptidase [Rhodococcus sp. MEB064]
MTTRPAHALVQPELVPLPAVPLEPSRRDPSGGADGRAWAELVAAAPEFARVHIDRGASVTMSDGAVLRAIVVSPADSSGRAVDSRFPVVLNITPYNSVLLDSVDAVLAAPVIGRALRSASRAVDFTGTPFDGISEITRVVAGGAADLLTVNRLLVRSGYVQVIVDARGTGSSSGVWDTLGPREQLDTLEILEWIRQSSWCDGRVGMAGISYSAINSLQAASAGSAGPDAVFAVEGSEDIVREIFATGGAPSLFIPLWLTAVNTLKWVPTPRLLARGGRAWLADRLRSPATNISNLVNGFLTGSDPRIYDDPSFDTIDPRIEDISVPTFLYGCWHDIFGGAAPDMYNRLTVERGRKQLLVGDGYHGNPGIGFGEPGFPPRLDVLERAWFDKWLRGIDNGIDRYGPVTLRQQGGGWEAHGRFPAPAAVPRRLYLSADSSGTASHSRHDGSLHFEAPTDTARLTVKPGFRTVVSRDTTQVLAGVPAVLGGGFTYDNRFAEGDALTFTTPPVVDTVVYSGPANVHLRTVSRAREAMWAVMLCDVAPDGTPTVLTNGALLASRRAIDDDASTLTDDGDYLVAHHPLTRESLLPVVPGDSIVLDIELLSTEAVLHPGHRLRLDIFAADAPRFLPILPDRLRTRWRAQDVAIDPENPSFITLPLLGEPGW